VDNAVRLINALVRAGWSLNVMHEVDTGGNPFITVEAVRRPDHVHASWHTRDNQGKYRLFSLLVNEQEFTLSKALEFVKTEGGESGD
jgi:REP element-mobilizing transposase RayT